MTVLTGGIVTYAVVSQNSKQSVRRRVTTNTPTATTSTNEQQTLTTNNDVATSQLTVNGTNNNSASLQSNIGQSQTSNTAANNTPSLPGPETFGQYEQYNEGNEIKYIEVKVGTGDTAEPGKQVAVLYKGWLSDGTLFDETRTNDEGQLVPFTFTLGAGNVIQGWEQGIAGMKVGGYRRLIIPAAVGYGEQGQGTIPPGALLIFDVQIVAVQ